MNLAAFDLNLLEVLDALLREGSTVSAGRRIGLSQPAVSAALGRLRHALNDPLFVRVGARLVPTDFARGLEAPLRGALDGLTEMLSNQAEFDPSSAEGTFRIAGIDFFAELLMPALAARVMRDAPGLRVQLLNVAPNDICAPLERGEVDVLLVPQADFPDWTEHDVAFRSPFAMIAAADNAAIAAASLAPDAPLPLDLFCELGHVLLSTDGKLAAMGDAALRAAGRERRVAVTMPVFGGIFRTVAQSELVSLVPASLARLRARDIAIQVRPLPVELDIAVPTICLVWHPRSTQAPAHRWMRATLAELLRPLDMVR